MQVETYECSETAAEPIEACEEAVGIIEALGLEGQKALVATDDGPAKRCPYREMTDEERFVFGVLCPTKTPLTRYNAGPVPLRVLQIAAHANSLGIYRRLDVWHVAKQHEPDPVLIGIIGDSDWSISGRHLLARWADELESWPVLLKRAIDRKRAQVADAYGVLMRKLQRLAAGDEMGADELIEKGSHWRPELRL